MSEHVAFVWGADSAHLARTLCAKTGAHKKNRTSLVRTRTPSALARAWRAFSAHAKAKPVRLGGSAHG